MDMLTKENNDEASGVGDSISEISVADRVRLLPPASPSDNVIYWEHQYRDRLCGLHCLNALLQGPVFSEVDLSTVALYLDEEERKLIYAPIEGNTEISELMAGGSTNVANDGFFSISVLEECLKRHHITITPSGVLPAWTFNPADGEAFVCHHHDHWFAIRKLHRNWYNLDSLKPAPSRIGEIYLDTFLHWLIEQGYSVFIVNSSSPDQALPLPYKIDQILNSNQFYLTDRQIDALVQLDKEYHQKALEAETLKYGGKGGGNSLSSSIAPPEKHSWPTEGGRRINDITPVHSEVSSDVSSDPHLAEAIKLSLAEFANTLTRPSPEPNADAANVLTIQVRLPNGERLVRRFQDTDMIKSIFHWIELEAQAVIASNTSYELVASYPKRILRRLGREYVEYQTANDEIQTNFGDVQLSVVITSKQDLFMLQFV